MVRRQSSNASVRPWRSAHEITALFPLLLAFACQAGLFQDGGQCRECSVGFYCPGGGQMIPCPDNATTISQAKSPSDCVCAAGYFFATSNGSSTCLPCARRNYKPSVGNSDCPLSCPTSADSEPGSVGLADCFCQPGYYASVSSTGQLDRCIGCHFQGLECRGGFEKSNGTVRVHAQPIALCLGLLLRCSQAPHPYLQEDVTMSQRPEARLFSKWPHHRRGM